MTPPVQWGRGWERAPLRLRLAGALLSQDTAGPTVSGAASRRHTQAPADPLSSGRSPRQGPWVHEGKSTPPGGQHPWKPPLPPGKAALSSGLREPPRREGGDSPVVAVGRGQHPLRVDQDPPAHVLPVVLQRGHERPGVRGHFSPSDDLLAGACKRKCSVSHQGPVSSLPGTAASAETEQPRPPQSCNRTQEPLHVIVCEQWYNTCKPRGPGV